MRYIKVYWHHDFDDDPVMYFHEVGDDDWEIRRVQVYRDGRTEWADENHETDTAGTAEIPITSIAEIASQSEFDAEEITHNEFEREWSKARGR
ncbi:DUF6881 domain-containing protein [Nocardia sp. BMG111209]|uniref:DUF6881 domain-containing protein n=1 Tax=Nocardia sp. BMG111209 TaxID=1160137 RepID=UPI0009DBA837|nr:hypothetical protein [Nocardia sp. BMG111209]